MSIWRDSNINDIWNFNPKTVPSGQDYDTKIGYAGTKMHEIRSDDCNSNAKNPWNQIFMQNDFHGQKNEDYKISSSLKTIWNDSSSEARSSSSTPDKETPSNNTPRGTCLETAIQLGFNGVQPKCAKIFGSVSDTASNVSSSNSMKGRAITSRNGGYNVNLGNGNGSQTYSSALQHEQLQPLDQFVQQVQLIVKNGFLDSKILDEPISPETFDLVQMLIYYVMEYSRTRNYANGDNDPVLAAEIQNISYKINLIQNEIAKCQLQYVQQQRIQEDILQSFSTFDVLQHKAHHFNGQTSAQQYGGPTVLNGNSKFGPAASSSPNACGYPSKAVNNEKPNQRFQQRQFDQFAQPTNVHTSAKFTFLPKAKNINTRSHYYEHHNRYFSQRDANFSTN